MQTMSAHVFQHKYTGVQIFVFHVEDEVSAKMKFYNIVTEHTDWVYLCIKQVLY